MNVKKGDLAILMRAANSENVGRIVSVIDFCGDIYGEKDVWAIDFQAPAKFHNPETGERGEATNLAAPDAWLRPVSGLPISDEVLDEVCA